MDATITAAIATAISFIHLIAIAVMTLIASASATVIPRSATSVSSGLRIVDVAPTTTESNTHPPVVPAIIASIGAIVLSAAPVPSHIHVIVVGHLATLPVIARIPVVLSPTTIRVTNIAIIASAIPSLTIVRVVSAPASAIPPGAAVSIAVFTVIGIAMASGTTANID